MYRHLSIFGSRVDDRVNRNNVLSTEEIIITEHNTSVSTQFLGKLMIYYIMHIIISWCRKDLSMRKITEIYSKYPLCIGPLLLLHKLMACTIIFSLIRTPKPRCRKIIYQAISSIPLTFAKILKSVVSTYVLAYVLIKAFKRRRYTCVW